MTAESSLSGGMQKNFPICLIIVRIPKPCLFNQLFHFGGKLGAIFTMLIRLTDLADHVPFTNVCGQNKYCGIPFGMFLSLNCEIASKL